MKRAVFLDRDGVLNEAIVKNGVALAPLVPGDFVLLPEAAAQVARLKAAGLTAIVFTNQPEVARGNLKVSDLETMHVTMRETISLDGVFVCPHDSSDGCTCRKPRPGMLLEGAREYGVELDRSFVIGDRWRDIDAGKSVGCYSILLERSYSDCTTADARVGDLSAAVDLVLARLGESA